MSVALGEEQTLMNHKHFVKYSKHPIIKFGNKFFHLNQSSSIFEREFSDVVRQNTRKAFQEFLEFNGSLIWSLVQATTEDNNANPDLYQQEEYDSMINEVIELLSSKSNNN